MNFHELYRKIEAIDKGQSLDEFLGFGKKKEQPAPAPTDKPPVGGKPTAPPPSGQPSPAPGDNLGGMAGNAVDAMKKRQQMLKDLEERGPTKEGYYKDPDGDDEDAADAADRADDERRSREEELDECGDMMSGMPPPMDAPKQADSVTMNVSMNGSGAGGIRDLLNVLKDIQDGPDDMHQEPDMDNMGGPSDHDADNADGVDVLLKKNLDGMDSAIDDDFANGMAGEPGPEILPAHDAGADLHKEKGAYPKASGGDNAMKIKPGQTHTFDDSKIKITLENLYNEIKSR